MPLMGTKNYRHLNKRVNRVDAADKITGKAVYAADINLPGMIYGGCLRSRYAHAEIISIDTSGAEAIEGVHAVLTAKDVPKPRSWADYPFLSNNRVRYIG